jgi:hypothetical protein
LIGPPTGLIQRLHPEGFCDVGNRLREAMQGGGTRLQSSGKVLPPDIEQRVDRIGGAAADFLADPLDGGTFAGAEQGIRGEFDVAGRNAAG